ncbi:hypothetical protein F7Q91_03175 [Vibrio chagasii]|uniref:Uncharacterized protein n=1 Tax=Vibrio chagasii TaxID=170679 RepID=A0A7V7NWY7_9VIBR|nr:hypothetical protein [Vibrio chagasii]KAB0482424.1 hypothetical protein F7Q91_03175 [Vibrio chagasii]
MNNNEKEPIPNNEVTATAGNTQAKTNWFKEAIYSLKDPIFYTFEFLVFILVFGYIVEKISPVPIIASLLGIGVPFLIGFMLLTYVFSGMLVCSRKWFSGINRRALFFLPPTFLGIVAAFILFIFYRDDVVPLLPIQILASGLNYTVIFLYTFLTLFVTAGFSDNKHVESSTLRIVSASVIACSLILFLLGINYSQFGTLVIHVGAGSLLLIIGAKLGIYLCIRVESGTSSLADSIERVRLKARENQQNEVFFASLGLTIVLPVFILLAWVAHESDYNTVQFICYEQQYIPDVFGNFASDCEKIAQFK